MKNQQGVNSGDSPKWIFELRGLLSKLDTERLMWPVVLGLGAAGLMCLLITLPQHIGTNAVLEIIANSGAFAPLIAFFTAGGCAYLVMLRYRNVIPSPGKVTGESAGLSKLLEELVREHEKRRKPPTESGTESGPKGKKSDRREAQIGSALDKKQLDEILRGLTGHAWLSDRLSKVVVSLVLEGPEAARADNQMLTEQEESNTSVLLIPAQVCEWILPLLGFLGTVWGLHLAIGPLSSGVRQMMDLVRQGGTTNDAVMELFGAGFAGLRTAFDTTLLGLAGAVCVGLLLFQVRRRAMKSLCAVHEVADGVIREHPIPMKSLHELLGSILQAIKDGLIVEREDDLQPRLQLLYDAISQGLFHTPEKAVEPQPWLGTAVQQVSESAAKSASSISDSVRQAEKTVERAIEHGAGSLALIQLNQLQESRLRSALQMSTVAPDLRAIRNQVCDTGREKVEIIPPTIDVLFKLDKTRKVQALAVANNGARACVAGLIEDANLYFVQDKSIEWHKGEHRLSHGIGYEGWMSAKAGSHGEDFLDVDAEVLGINYAPDSRRIFVLCRGGVCCTFIEGRREESQLPVSIPAFPFVWHPSNDASPLIALWEKLPEGFRFQLVSATDPSRRIEFDSQLETALESLQSTCAPPNASGRLRIRGDNRLLCIGGKDALVVAQFADGDELRHVSSLQVEPGIVAFDLTARGRFVLFADTEGALRKWYFEDDAPAERVMAPANRDQTINVYLNANGDMFALLSGSTIQVYDLDNSNRSKILDTGGLSLAGVEQSLDRQNLIVATDENLVSLFSFSLRL